MSDPKYFKDIDDAAKAMADAELDLCSDKVIPTASGEAVHDELCDCCEEDYDPGIPFVDVWPDEKLLEETLSFAESQESKDEQEVQEALDCADKIQQACDEIQSLGERLMDARASESNLEMLWYNYRILGQFFLEKKKAFEQILGVFDPLVTQKRFLQSQLQQDPNSQSIQAQIQDVDNQILFQSSLTGVAAIKEVFDASLVGRDLTLRAILSGNQESPGFLALPVRAAQFSTRALVVPVPDFTPGDGVSFRMTIQHRFDDPAGVTSGRPKSYLSSNPFRNPVIVVPFNGPAAGTLYDRLYGIWGDAKKFFTPEERSLTTVREQADPETDGAKIDGLYIKDVNAYYDFQTNYPQRVYEKAKVVKSSVIEPALAAIMPEAKDAALAEVLAVLAYGEVWDSLIADNGDLKSAVDASLEGCDRYISRLEELEYDLGLARKRVETYEKAIADAMEKLKKSPCVDKGDTTEKPDEVPPGQSLVKSLSGTDMTLPNPTKFCYWRKFARMATMVNVLPLPGSGGFRYWPVGLVIPTPGGPVRVPLPIVWIPLTVITMKAGVMVVFIAQCGVSPGPVVFMLGADGKKKFVVAPRPGQIFGTDAADLSIKTKDKLGFAEKLSTDSFLKDLKIPQFTATPLASKSAAVGDIRKKVMTAFGKINFPQADVNAPGFSFSKYVSDACDKMSIPDVHVPRDHKKANPQPTQAKEIYWQLKGALKAKLPNISLTGGQISMRDKVLMQVGFSSLEIEPPAWPGASAGADIDAAVSRIADYQARLLETSIGKVTPSVLGVLAQVDGEISVIDAYNCRQETSGLKIPAPPSAISLALGAIGMAMQPLPKDQIVGLLGSLPLTPYQVGAIMTNQLKNAIRALPEFNIPDPSNTSITSSLTDSMKKVAAIQKPSKPDPTRPPLRVTVIPGAAVKAAIKRSAVAAARQVDIPPTATSADLKVLAYNTVESSLDAVESVANPIIATVEFIGDFSPGSLLEKFGLELSPVGRQMAYVTQDQLQKAMDILTALPAAAYVAVATSPGLFKDLHPLLSADDIPPWERLSLKNFLFVVFLDMWCKEGKKVCGLFENP